MIYILLNIAILLIFMSYVYYIDKKLSSDNKEASAMVIPALLVCVETFLFIVVLICRTIWEDGLLIQIMKIVLALESIFLVTFSFALINLVKKVKGFFVRLIQIGLFAFGIYIVYFTYSSIEISFDGGIIIASEYIFSNEAVRKFFPWTWVTVYAATFRYFCPAICYLFLMLILEKEGNELQRYQGLIIGEAIALMWVLHLFFDFIARVQPSYTLLYLFSYLILFIIVCSGLSKTSIPSGRGMFVSVFKFFISYFIPAGALGVFAMYFQPQGSIFTFKFLAPFLLLSSFVMLIALKISGLLSSSTKLYTADYSDALERDLASIDYSGDMDVITNKMFEIVKKNIETSFMNVYISDGKGTLDVAYTSNNETKSISLNNPIFDFLLNIDKSVIIYSAIEKEHALSPMENELKKFFNDAKADAVFILNEGRNIVGLITMGKKISGDHLKEYDYNVFTKYYSYFFVFGYYMRNISNKEVISTVNREIKMSSQIITSIQENIDHVKNEKSDIGYLMVPAHNIGGEFIDMIRLTDTRHLFVIGDLSGKGIAASMNMVILKSIIRTYLAETHDFKTLVVKINSFIRDSLRKGTIFAGLFALMDYETDTIYYINCGIPTFMLYTLVYNNVIEIQGSGHVLGFVKDISPYISVKTTKLNPGDIILACTDGLVQSHSLRGEQFGKERVQQALLDNSTYPAQRMVQFTFDSLGRFMSKEMEDDVSIFVMKYESGAQFVEEDKSEETPETESEVVPSSEETIVTENVIAEENVQEEVSEVIQNEIATEQVVVEDVVSDEIIQEDIMPEIAMPNEFVQEEIVADEVASEEVSPAVVESENVSEESDIMADLPDDLDIPDLSNLDEMMKLAGL